MTLERDDRVFTESSGSKRGRHVVIYPKGHVVKKRSKGEGDKSAQKNKPGRSRRRRRPDNRSGKKPDGKSGAPNKGGGRGGGKSGGKSDGNK
jgi:hypothetical protein